MSIIKKPAVGVFPKERKSTRDARRGGPVQVYKMVDGEKIFVREDPPVPKGYVDKDFDTDIRRKRRGN